MINKQSFLVNYIMSLKERTRHEKGEFAIGFDWIIFNLFLVKGFNPIEIPFIRNVDHTKFKAKVSPQFGVDMAFVKENELVILVLKDEPLTYSNWFKHGFDSDLSRASSPDPKVIKNEKITSQKIILAYNKDEDSSGIEQFDRVVFSLEKRTLENTSFEKWNITKIVDEVENYLLTPELLPQHLTVLLSFICQLIQKTEFGSQQWEQLLIPNWKLFLKQILNKKIRATQLRMIPISLVIIDSFRDKSNPNSHLGFIELIEWAVITGFSKAELLNDQELLILHHELWGNLYLFELVNFLERNDQLINTEHGLTRSLHLWSMAPLNDAVLVYWYISRIAILYVGYSELTGKDDKSKARLDQILSACKSWLKNLIRFNSGAYRPLVDMHHIQLYLIWFVLNDPENQSFLAEYFSELGINLLVRKLGKANLPFIEGGNRFDLVAEFIVSPEPKNNVKSEFVDNSSYLLLMVIEMILTMEHEISSDLLERYWCEIVLGKHRNGESMGDNVKSIKLQSVEPVDNWDRKVFSEGSETVTAVMFPQNIEIHSSAISEEIPKFIKRCANEFPNKIKFQHPLGSYILACLKNNYPLPPYFWRKILFPDLVVEADQKFSG